jgi:hypothetical protein
MTPIVFRAAILAYVVSFALVAVSTNGDGSILGVGCAYMALLMLVNPVVNSRFFEGKAAEYIPVLIFPWINIAFLASLTIRWRRGNGVAFRTLRTATLLMIPSCWMVFYNDGLFPREGHFLWVVGMVLALFSESSSSSRLMTTGSQP